MFRRYLSHLVSRRLNRKKWFPMPDNKSTLFDCIVRLKMLLNFRQTVLHGVTLNTRRSWIPRAVRKSLFQGSYESPECTMVIKHVKPGDRVLEIGCGIGLVGILAARQCGSENVFCFEANPALERIIRDNHTRNDLTPNLIMKAVTANGRDLTFFQDRKLWGSSIFDRKRETNKISIQSVPMQALIEAHRPSVLVIDAEGAEIELLPSADMSDVDRIIIEIHPQIVDQNRIEALVEKLISQGFRLAEQQDLVLFFAR